MSKTDKEDKKIAQDFIVFGNQKDETDLITKSIREDVLNKQLAILSDWFKDNAPDKDSNKDLNREDLKNYLNDKDNAQKLFADKALKVKFEEAEIKGYKSVLDNPEVKARMQNLEWDKQELETKSKIVENANGEEICTLKETSKSIALEIDNDGKSVKINSYRTIDFPVSLKAEGPLHLALAVKDKDGNNIAEDKAVYFTAHYDKQGKLTEMSTPQPVKFMDKGDDAACYIEHQGERYTLPVTQGKYKEMMQSIAKNNGLAIDISKEVEIKEKPLAKDTIITPSVLVEQNLVQDKGSSEKIIQQEKTEIIEQVSAQKSIWSKISDFVEQVKNKITGAKEPVNKITNDLNENRITSESYNKTDLKKEAWIDAKKFKQNIKISSQRENIEQSTEAVKNKTGETKNSWQPATKSPNKFIDARKEGSPVIGNQKLMKNENTKTPWVNGEVPNDLYASGIPDINSNQNNKAKVGEGVSEIKIGVNKGDAVNFISESGMITDNEQKTRDAITAQVQATRLTSTGNSLTQAKPKLEVNNSLEKQSSWQSGNTSNEKKQQDVIFKKAPLIGKSRHTEVKGENVGQDFDLVGNFTETQKRLDKVVSGNSDNNLSYVKLSEEKARAEQSKADKTREKSNNNIERSKSFSSNSITAPSTPVVKEKQSNKNRKMSM